MTRTSQPPRESPLGLLSTDTFPVVRTSSWSVLWRGKEIELHEGVATLGRAPTSTIMVDRPSVSRVHARFFVGKTSLTIEDFHSSNGVFVNGVRIEGSQDLRSGDRLLFGTEEFVVLSGDESSELVVGTVSDEVSDIHTIPSEDSGPTDWRRGQVQRQSGLQTTQKADAFLVLGRLADRMLVMGRPDAAIKVLHGHMQELLAAAQSGEPVSLEVVICSTNYALKIASFTKDSAWLDFVFDLHFELRSLLTPDAVRQIETLLNNGTRVDRELFKRYCDMIQLMHSGAAPARCRQILDLKLPEP